MDNSKPANRWEAYKMLEKKLILKRVSRIPLLTFSETYTQVNAYNLALFAILAYSDKNSVYNYFKEIYKKGGRDFSCDNGTLSESPFVVSADYAETFNFNPDNDFVNAGEGTQFIITGNSKQILISVRGTEPDSIRDWLRDANAEEVEFTEGTGQVHAGFYNGFQCTKEYIDKYFQLHWSKDIEVIVTGHSLGGAIATLIAAYIRDKYDTTKVMLYTYGSPRVGDRTFAKYYSTTKKIIYFRVVNDNDLVTMVPLPGMDLKPHLLPAAGVSLYLLPMAFIDLDNDPYTHTGKLVHIHKLTDRNAAISPGYSKIAHALLSLNPPLMAGKITLDGLLQAKESITDHFMGSYFPILKNDLIKTIKAYLTTEDVDLRDDREGILALENEIGKLIAKRDELLNKADIEQKLADQDKNNMVPGSYHSTEASKYKYEASKINVVIANKNFDLVNLKKWVQHFEENNKNKQYLLKKLISRTTNQVIENEFEYHSKS